jgi:spore maturation protein CgeB
MREEFRARGLETIRARHTCGHRATELMSIVAGLRTVSAEAV